jgi:hypothetical protein
MSSILVWEIVTFPNFMQSIIRETYMIDFLKNTLNNKLASLSGV